MEYDDRAARLADALAAMPPGPSRLRFEEVLARLTEAVPASDPTSDRDDGGNPPDHESAPGAPRWSVREREPADTAPADGADDGRDEWAVGAVHSGADSPADETPLSAWDRADTGEIPMPVWLQDVDADEMEGGYGAAAQVGAGPPATDLGYFAATRADIGADLDRNTDPDAEPATERSTVPNPETETKTETETETDPATDTADATGPHTDPYQHLGTDPHLDPHTGPAADPRGDASTDDLTDDDQPDNELRDADLRDEDLPDGDGTDGTDGLHGEPHRAGEPAAAHPVAGRSEPVRGGRPPSFGAAPGARRSWWRRPR